MNNNSPLRDAREALGLSQSELARLVQMSPLSISAIENGRRSPMPSTVDRLAKVVGDGIRPHYPWTWGV